MLRFVVNSQILFEAVDVNGTPIPYEILPQKAGSQTIRMGIAVDSETPQGPGAITLVGEAVLVLAIVNWLLKRADR